MIDGRVILFSLLAIVALPLIATSARAEPTDSLHLLDPPLELAPSATATQFVERRQLLGTYTRFVIQAGEQTGRPDGSKLEFIASDHQSVLATLAPSEWKPNSLIISPPIFAKEVALVGTGLQPGARIGVLMATLQPPEVSQPLAPVVNWVPVNELVRSDARLGPLASAVVILFFDGVTRSDVTCTGFLFEEQTRIITNRHCIVESQAFVRSGGLSARLGRCDDVIVRFHYWTVGGAPSGRKVKCIEAYSEAEGPDLAGLKVEYEKEFSPLTALKPSPSPLTNLETLEIVHYPWKGPAVDSTCRYLTLDRAQTPVNDGFYFRHRCSTVGGSSGSPVLDPQGKVIGVHYWAEADGWVTFAAAEQQVYEGKPLLNRAITLEQLLAFVTRMDQR
jgi:hypothetical protein